MIGYTLKDKENYIVENCVIVQRVEVIHYRRCGTTYRSYPYGSLNLEGGTDRLSRNVSKELPLLAA